MLNVTLCREGPKIKWEFLPTFINLRILFKTPFGSKLSVIIFFHENNAFENMKSLKEVFKIV